MNGLHSWRASASIVDRSNLGNDSSSHRDCDSSEDKCSLCDLGGASFVEIEDIWVVEVKYIVIKDWKGPSETVRKRTGIWTHCPSSKDLNHRRLGFLTRTPESHACLSKCAEVPIIGVHER